MSNQKSTPSASHIAWRWFRALYWTAAVLQLLAVIIVVLILLVFTSGDKSMFSRLVLYLGFGLAVAVGLVVAVYQWAKAGKQFVYVFLVAPIVLSGGQIFFTRFDTITSVFSVTGLYLALLVGQVVLFYRYLQARKAEGLDS